MILDEIVKRKRKDLARARDERPLADLKARARNAPPSRDFAGALRRGPVAAIAEIKRASPSQGALRPDLDPARLARAYRDGGACALSVLTDAPFFQGSPEDLRAARATVDLPVLRKEFIIDEYQIYETRAMPADAVLLIVRILEPSQLADYAALAGEDLGLPVLVEVHDERDLEIALDAQASLLGINNRNLDDFSVSLETTERLRSLVPAGVTIVSESGIACPEDVTRLRHLGVQAMLVGESLLCSPDPAQALRRLLGSSGQTPPSTMREA